MQRLLSLNDELERQADETAVNFAQFKKEAAEQFALQQKETVKKIALLQEEYAKNVALLKMKAAKELEAVKKQAEQKEKEAAKKLEATKKQADASERLRLERKRAAQARKDAQVRVALEKKKQSAANAHATINQTRETSRKRNAEWKEKAGNDRRLRVNSNKRARDAEQQRDGYKFQAEVRLERLKAAREERDKAHATCEDLKEEANNRSSDPVFTIEKVMTKTADSNKGISFGKGVPYMVD